VVHLGRDRKRTLNETDSLRRKNVPFTNSENDLTFDSVFGRRKARKGCVLSTRKADSLIALFVRESEGMVKIF
jgi:hypothetical protein